MKILDDAYYNQKFFMMTTEVSIAASYMSLNVI